MGTPLSHARLVWAAGLSEGPLASRLYFGEAIFTYPNYTFVQSLIAMIVVARVSICEALHQQRQLYAWMELRASHDPTLVS